MWTSLSSKQIQKAEEFYLSHKNHIDIITSAEKYSPSDIDDKNNPFIWKPNQWLWFFNSLMKLKNENET